jgi:hypothetical protein
MSPYVSRAVSRQDFWSYATVRPEIELMPCGDPSCGARKQEIEAEHTEQGLETRKETKARRMCDLTFIDG